VCRGTGVFNDHSDGTEGATTRTISDLLHSSRRLNHAWAAAKVVSLISGKKADCSAINEDAEIAGVGSPPAL